MVVKRLVSFGMKYGLPEYAHLNTVIDVRPLFGRNPYHDKKLRGLRGTDKLVQEDILLTPNFDLSYDILKRKVIEATTPTVYIGCTGGHHRSVYLTERLARELGVEWQHRDIDKDRKL